MKTVVEYLNYSFEKIEKERKEKETLMNSKIIEANEIHKTVAKLVFDDNDTYNVFNASGTHVEFRNREVSQLKTQEDNLKLEADELAYQIKELNLELEKISIAIAHANATNEKLNRLSNENIRLNAEVAMYATGGKKKRTKKTDIDETDSTNPSDIELVDSVSDDYSLDQNAVYDMEPINYNEDSNSFLRQIADRLFFLAHLVKTDPYRIKLELDEIYKSINKFLNK